MDTNKSSNTRISFQFAPDISQSGNNAVEKADSQGRKRRFLEGASSGIKVDGHGERMTSKAIESFQRQAQSGDLLLYPAIHGIKFNKDIGILVDSKILENGDWWTSYRMYDDFDTNIGRANIDDAKTCWAQIVGLPPYSKPKERGFSIEGHVPEDAIISKKIDGQGNYYHRVIDDVVLEGVVLVSVPAYGPSMARSVYKALGELLPIAKQSIEQKVFKSITEIINENELEEKYYSTRFKIEDALEKSLKAVLRINDGRERDRISSVMKGYSDAITNLILDNTRIFRDDPDRARDVPAGNEMTPLTKAVMTVTQMLVEKTRRLSNEHSKQQSQ